MDGEETFTTARQYINGNNLVRMTDLHYYDVCDGADPSSVVMDDLIKYTEMWLCKRHEFLVHICSAINEKLYYLA